MTPGDGPEPAGPDRTGPGAAGPEHARIRPYLDAAHPAPPAGRAPGDGDGADRPRPFILTAGRVDGADPSIGLETQVTAARPPPWVAPVTSLAPELQAIIALCAEPVSVAEISAQVPLHLGVTKILVGDLRANGYLDVHTRDVANPHDPETILRVIRGLRAIA